MNASSLILLPRELRDLIYEHTFTTPYAVTLQPHRIEHPLTKTCRQLRHETLSLYYSLTRFNAHLDDGPATPLAEWLKAIGPERALRVEKINVWDLHMLNATLRGHTATNRLLASTRKSYILQAIGGPHLDEIVCALRTMGLELSRFCTLDAEGCEGARVKLTSEFAIVGVGQRYEWVPGKGFEGRGCWRLGCGVMTLRESTF